MAPLAGVLPDTTLQPILLREVSILSIVIRALIVLLAAASGGSAIHDPQVQFGRRGETARFETICRSEALELPRALVIAEFIIENGGRTCFVDGRGVLFVPERGGRCPSPSSSQMGEISRLPLTEAEQEVLRCSVFAIPSSDRPTEVAVYRPNPGRKDAGLLFDQFGVDAAALAIYDMLPVTHFGAAFGVVCLEAADARFVVERIREANIADPADLLVDFHTGACRDVTPAYTDSPWPEFVLG